MGKDEFGLEEDGFEPLMGHSGDPDLELNLRDVLLEAFKLWQERHRKYGRSNIAEFGEVGCLVRASDKMARLKEHYLGRARQYEFKDETISDSWLDMLNYAAMGLLCHRDKWLQKTEPPPKYEAR